ncbi:MAG: hypothetical protein HY756_10660 [Nitrospirae bacterium]|nr:hypothetical protein [Nitrospirota bacterium]
MNRFLRLDTLRGKTKTLAILIFIISSVLILSSSTYTRWQNSSAGCISCHSNEAKIKSLGYPYFYVTPEQVKKESKHKKAQCRDCHLGDGRTGDIDKAHKGMLKMIIVGEDGELLQRKNFFPHALKPEGDDQLNLLLPKIKVGDKLSVSADVRSIIYHDRSLETLGYDPEIAQKTCGKKGCHTNEIKQFSRTVMGTNFRQRAMKSWLIPYGPHNCGPSFADTSAAAKENKFSFENHDEIVKNLNTHFTKEQAVMKQKLCNACHAGCLDCHFTPFKGSGSHSFSKTPPAESCMGGGRGSTMCHAGSGESRRGSTYLGGTFSKPEGMKPDVHAGKLNCIDCHKTGAKGMGDIERKANCSKCHYDAVKALSKGRHKRLQCIACHTNEARGYQLTHWGEGYVGGKPNPFKKYFYYGIVSPPVIMKDHEGLWIPVKIMPHTVSNIKEPVPASNKVLFRWPDGETSDSYAILGTFDNLPSGNLHLAWLDIEKLSHSYNRARSCESCHGGNGAQRAVSQWEFADDQGAEPFKGSYKIIADKEGLRVTDIKAETPIRPYPGGNLSDFAPWYYLKDIWQVPGDYSIPSKDFKQGIDAYNRATGDLAKLKARIKENEFKTLKEKTVHGF